MILPRRNPAPDATLESHILQSNEGSFIACIHELYAKLKKWELETVQFITGYCKPDRNPIGMQFLKGT